MNRSNVIRPYDILKSYKINMLRDIIYYYKQELTQTFQFLKDSKDFLEYKKMAKKISAEVYTVRFSSLMNMALVYFYALYEGFNRTFFEKLLRHDTSISHREFKRRYPEFYDIKHKVIRGIYHIRISQEIFDVIDILRRARNGIVHLGKKCKQDFEIVDICYEAIVKYYELIEKEVK